MDLEADPEDWAAAEDPESEAEEAERDLDQVASDREPDPALEVRDPYVLRNKERNLV